MLLVAVTETPSARIRYAVSAAFRATSTAMSNSSGADERSIIRPLPARPGIRVARGYHPYKVHKHTESAAPVADQPCGAG
ncbi:hypothetical protein GCM10009541_24390 [Micromonospora gifhornensis]|uniref:Uncharacterized protein n=1 Tax=Micromonospora gifhornensis TaxID=84594 RepID=A0ABQ4IJI6_9ACTN|nr:hypothetical protein Vgi01_45670 [Micromonospora gifhornensis]